MNNATYNFKTAISLVIGVVIGSGIFYKADDILAAVGGRVWIGVLGFLIVGIGIIFGALSIAYYAVNDTTHTGIIGYSNTALGRKFAFLVGWFNIICYYPALIIVMAVADGIYFGQLLGINSQIFVAIATGLFLILTFAINIISPKFGGKMQVASTIGKIIPLAVIGLVGLLFFDNTEQVVTASQISSSTPFAALISIAFAFDGWIVATNISGDLDNPSRNMPRALFWGTLAIVIIYIIYFLGITHILEPNQIIALGDAHTTVAAEVVVGPLGGKIITAFIVISVYGGLNGMVIGYLPMPKMLVDDKLMKVNPKYTTEQLMRWSIIFSLIITFGYYIVQELIDFGIIFSNLDSYFDIASLPLVAIYIIYSILYLYVNILVKNDRLQTRIYYLVITSIAIITSIVIIAGTMEVNGLLYIGISFLLCLCGLPFYHSNSK